MEDFEKLGAFYLGREYDLKKKKQGGLLLYDSKDLVTHAVCVGMTGSGKTGLCLALLEEAAIDGVPAIMIDPKGDLADLLLTFPDLKGADFLPWVNEEDAQKKGLAPKEFAEQQAKFWKDGLAQWGEDGERIRKLRQAAEFRIYTPGSSAGIPVSIMKSFDAPAAAVVDDSELFQERINTTVTSLLGLIGIEADPIKSREHILLSTVIGTAWKAGKGLDLPALIQGVQTPPIEKIGVLDLESFYPSKDRFELVMRLNNLLAAPGFSTWLEGEPMDIGAFLHGANGKPRMSIFSIAHLNDAERMFFVSLLLTQVLGWVRAQSGTTSLRAILYMDEIFGYFPPVANPPSKTPLLTLLKQARAFGLGVVLTTQNPVDLDYKGLSNAGTWFIGRLQAERDKARLLEGLEGAAASGEMKFNRKAMEQTIAGLENRVFIMNNVHDDAPVVFQVRWAMSYLRGPLTRDQIKSLMDPVKAASPSAAKQAAPRAAASVAAAAPEAVAATGGTSAGQPAVPPDVQQFYLPVRGATQGVVYRPAVLGVAMVNYTDAKLKVDVTQTPVYLTPFTSAAIPISWENAAEAGISTGDLQSLPAAGAAFGDLPAAGLKAKNYAAWEKELSAWLAANRALSLFYSAERKLISNPGESESEFAARLQLAGREKRDDASEALRKKYAPKIASLEERKRKAEQAVEREAEQAKDSQMQTVISVGSTLLGAFVGRRRGLSSTVGRATTAARGASRAVRQQQDVGRAKETVEALDQQIADLDAQFKAELASAGAGGEPTTASVETLQIKAKKTGITVKLLALGWAPYVGDRPVWK
jgi:hypothetical protein